MTKSNKILVLVSPDKLGRFFLSKAPQDHKIIYAYDQSSNHKRLFKLIIKRILKVRTVFLMLWADFFREKIAISNYPTETIYNNTDLRELIKKENITTVYLFRAGLIISKVTLKEQVEFLNIHCAKIPQYGGIGVLDRALRDKAFKQEATLHVVTETIDGGRVISVEPYIMSPQNSYQQNEDIAYRAGADLLVKNLRSFLKNKTHC
jgi:folate-dependent phosphoribosylglycinamide formyltransferase PurN